MRRRGRHLWVGLLAGGLAIGAASARAQSIEPRAYSTAPTGVNFIIVGVEGSRGGLSLDPSIDLTSPHLKSTGPVFAYARAIDLFGRSAKIDVIAPVVRLSGDAQYQGEPVGRTVTGLADPRARLSVNLYGGPAMNAAEFATYRPKLIVGASVQVTAPVGQYDRERLLNLSAHRWAVKPELGVSKSVGRWTLELQAGVTVYTANEDFFAGHRRTEQPVYSAQVHAIYSFRSGAWAAFDATWYGGGRTTIDRVLNDDLERNWRVGATLALPVSPRHSIKLTASRGVFARTGGNFDLAAIAWQYRWGGGI